MLDFILLVLAGVMSFLFGWNNSSFLIGNTSGSGTLTMRESMLISAVGLFLGIVIEGSKMIGGLNGTLTSDVTTSALVATLAASILITLVLTLLRLPVSFSMTMIGAFVGAALASSVALDFDHLELTAILWFAAPLLTAGLTFAMHGGISRILSHTSLVSVDAVNRAGVTVSSLAVAYVLGGNNIGLIYDAAGRSRWVGQSSGPFILLAVLAMAGMWIFGRGGVSGTIGDRMLVLSPTSVLAVFLSSAVAIWVGTQVQVPISISQCILGGMLGASLWRSVAIVNKKLVLETVSLWALVPMVAFATALLISPILRLS